MGDDTLELGRRFDALARGVLVPLVLGGRVTPVRPIGPVLATKFGEGRVLSDNDERARVSVARVRRVRLLAPVDALDEPDGAQWAMVAALNDLLQAANHELGGVMRSSRHAKLVAAVDALAARTRPPRSVGDALGRHATFARVFEVARKDTRVRWWTGSASFRGQEPPARLTAWPDFRKVSVEPTTVRLADMPAGLEALPATAFEAALASLVALSPVTDLANASRERPAFQWRPATIALVATPPGATVALRAVARSSPEAAYKALKRATEALGDSSAAAPAKAFCALVQQAIRRAKVESSAG